MPHVPNYSTLCHQSIYTVVDVLKKGQGQSYIIMNLEFP